uniref:BCL2 interacting protein like n=1 Tax=Amphilophus citrinellus TaxID=61819 RepID=A0A3Q0RN73_AMPCI
MATDSVTLTWQVLSNKLCLSDSAPPAAPEPPKRLVAPTLSLALNRRDSNDRNSFSAAALSGTPDDTPSLDINLEALETPSDSETGTLPDSQSEGLMELDQLDSRGRRWRRFCISGHEYQVNMSVLEPYLQVLSHGGYYGDGMNAIILFTSCYLPENTVEDYEYVMDNLFRLYSDSTLTLL